MVLAVKTGGHMPNSIEARSIRHLRGSASHSHNKWFPTQWRSFIVMVVCLVVLPYSCIGLIIYAHSFVFIWPFHYRVHGRVMLGAIKFERRQVSIRAALVIWFWRQGLVKVLAMPDWKFFHWLFNCLLPSKQYTMLYPFVLMLCWLLSGLGTHKLVVGVHYNVLLDQPRVLMLVS